MRIAPLRTSHEPGEDIDPKSRPADFCPSILSINKRREPRRNLTATLKLYLRAGVGSWAWADCARSALPSAFAGDTIVGSQDQGERAQPHEASAEPIRED